MNNNEMNNIVIVPIMYNGKVKAIKLSLSLKNLSETSI